MSGTAQEASPTAAPPDVSSTPQFSIRAIGDYEDRWFELIVDAGQSVDLAASVRNFGEVDATLHTYKANASNPMNGGFSAGSENEEPTGATPWIEYDSETFDLQSGQNRTIHLRVSVPENTPAGDYFAALVVETDEPVAIPGTDTFTQNIRSAVSVEIRVPGDMTSGFELGQPVITRLGDGWALDVGITNTGTARIRPEGQLVVATPDGEIVSTTDVEMGSVYGGNATNVRVTLPGQLPLSEYLVSLDLIDESTGATASIEDAPVTLAEPEVEEQPTFVVDAASVTPNGDPIQYADVKAVITNNGPAIPTANVTLTVMRDGEEVESYPLAQNQALPQGTTDFSQRYIPVDGWESGTWTFELVISAVSGATETVLAAVEIPDVITVP